MVCHVRCDDTEQIIPIAWYRIALHDLAALEHEVLEGAACSRAWLCTRTLQRIFTLGPSAPGLNKRIAGPRTLAAPNAFTRRQH